MTLTKREKELSERLAEKMGLKDPNMQESRGKMKREAEKVTETQVYGLLQMKDGSEIDLDGQELKSLKVDPTKIVGYGEDHLGDEAEIFLVTFSGLGERIKEEFVKGLENVRNLFK